MGIIVTVRCFVYHKGVKRLQNNLQLLMARKGIAEGRRLTLKQVSREAGVPYKTVLAMSDNTLREYPSGVIERICRYFECDPGELLVMVEE